MFVRSSMGKFASEGKGDEFIFHCESPSANTTRGQKRCVGETRLCELKGEMSARARALKVTRVLCFCNLAFSAKQP